MDIEKVPSVGALSKKLNKILESHLENDKETLEALKALSPFYTENTLRARRDLRSDIERRSLVINEEFLQSFKQAHDSLEAVYKDILAMNDCCQDMTSRLKTVKIQTNDLINQTSKLQSESQHLKLRQEVAVAFLDAYQLKPDEVKALRGTRDSHLDATFFQALARVRKIHDDCKVLLRTNQQTAGLEIMECMAMHLETAYERLYRWTQGECRMQTGDGPEIPVLICQAMEALQERPVLFRYCIDEFAAARRASVVRLFIDALTRGGAGGNPRPIELHSHDPVRYVGDMLAWIHQSSASEKEHLEALLKMCSPAACEEHMAPSLSHVMESTCRPLRMRMEQVIFAEPGIVTLYRLANLLKFYHVTIKQILPLDDSALLTTLSEINILSYKMFLNSIQGHMTRLLEKVESPALDLGPTETLVHTLALLRDILACHDSSIISPDNKQKDFAQILGYVIDPLLQMCVLSASKLNPAEMAVFLINCVYHVQTTLALFQYTDQRLEMLQAQIDAHLDTLINEQVSSILNQTGLATLYNVLQHFKPSDGPLSQMLGADALGIKSAMGKFDNFLSSPDNLIIAQHGLLQSATLRQQLKKNSMDIMCNAYQLIHSAILDAKNGYSDPFSLVPRTPDQIKQLLL